MKRLYRLVSMAFALLAVAAVVEQLRRSPGERTWHGRILSVPYDFRPPTPERVRAAAWDPENPSLLVPTVFGVGWSLNLAWLARLRSS